jgi:hypothetical protein
MTALMRYSVYDVVVSMFDLVWSWPERVWYGAL